MIFFSVKEFLYKLNTIGFILLLLPLGLFVFLHFYSPIPVGAIDDISQHSTLLIILSAIVLIDLTIVHLLWRIRLKRLKLLPELARKMDGYFVMVIVRNGAYTVSALLMAFGFYLTGSAFFTGAFLVILLAVMAQWPRPASFCNQFQLRGGERDMVLHNRDLVRKPTRKWS